MLRIIAKTSAGYLTDVPIDELHNKGIIWYWADFSDPTGEEIALMRTHFGFHDLSVEACLENMERPKVDYYDDYSFFVLQALDEKTLGPVEVDLFVGANFVVSFCQSEIIEIDAARQKLPREDKEKTHSPAAVACLIMDEIVDQYFPAVYRVEDSLSEIGERLTSKEIYSLIDKVFEIRSDLLKLRRIISSMKELLYRIINSGHLDLFKGRKRDINNIYDHLLKLSDIVESSRELTADVRDNYLSVNSHKMNKTMTFLTAITSIFIPLTFVAGVYGMNFSNMPELRWRFGYFIVLGAMAVIGLVLLLIFKRKGWFDIRK